MTNPPLAVVAAVADNGVIGRDNRLISPYADPAYKPDTYYFTDAISDQAVRYIEQHGEDLTILDTLKVAHFYTRHLCFCQFLLVATEDDDAHEQASDRPECADEPLGRVGSGAPGRVRRRLRGGLQL